MTTRTRILAAALAATLVLGGCSKTVPIGAVISESGALEDYGKEVRQGMELAATEINERGGVAGKTLQLIFHDDQSKPEVGTQAVQQLINEQDVKVIIGAVSSSVTLAIGPICDENSVVMLSPSASAPEISQLGEWVFRNYPSDLLEATAMAEFARNLDIERVAIFAADDVYGEGHTRVFGEKYPSTYRKIVATHVIKDGSGIAAAVEAMKTEEPDGIYIAGYQNDVAAVLRAVRAAGLRSVALTTSSVGRQLWSMIGQNAQDVVFPRPTSFDPASDDPETREFVADFQGMFGGEPTTYSAYGYDAVNLIATAIREGDSAHHEDIKFNLGKIKEYKGPTGYVSFDANGDVVQYPRLYIIRDGETVPYDRFIQDGGSLYVPGQR